MLHFPVPAVGPVVCTTESKLALPHMLARNSAGSGRNATRRHHYRPTCIAGECFKTPEPHAAESDPLSLSKVEISRVNDPWLLTEDSISMESIASLSNWLLTGQRSRVKNGVLLIQSYRNASPAASRVSLDWRLPLDNLSIETTKQPTISDTPANEWAESRQNSKIKIESNDPLAKTLDFRTFKLEQWRHLYILLKSPNDKVRNRVRVLYSEHASWRAFQETISIY